ncbi:MAG: excinuclease ABC subunit UvrC [Candidatus Omnitrophota bacterium]
MNDNVLKQLKNIPFSSGVYLMKDSGGKVIYVGKAVDLHKRVQSYFRGVFPAKESGKPGLRDEADSKENISSGKPHHRRRQAVSKTDLLVAEIKDIDCILTNSEAEALILEASLIKKYHPKYNVSLRDDKSYPYIEITGEDFPCVAVVRPREKKKGSVYFGPYTNAGLIRDALNIIRRIFPFRTCDPFPKKECLDYHIGLCEAPCIQNQTRSDYRKVIRNVSLILEGKKDELYRKLMREMEKCAKDQQFEKAAKLRDQIRAIGALYSGTKDINYFKEAEQLQRALHLPRLPERVETFDISNIMGQESVGSMVSFFNGKPDKQNYRRFKIRSVEGIDDFQMIAEVVRRRYQRLKEEKRLFPDLIVIDGGKGQLSAAMEELNKLELEIPIVSLAKREEEVFLPGRRGPVILSKDSLGLKLLQRCRDEAHRFAVNYHRKLRGARALRH